MLRQLATYVIAIDDVSVAGGQKPRPRQTTDREASRGRLHALHIHPNISHQSSSIKQEIWWHMFDYPKRGLQA